MQIHDVTSAAGARKRRKRVGRGESSGHGRTSGRGNKGAQARAGYGGRMLAEGGQAPIFRRVAKRGFNNFNFRTEYEVVNIGELDAIYAAGDRVDAETLRTHRLVQRTDMPVKILGDGELTKALTLQVDAISASAREAVEKAGGSVTLIERRDSAALWKAKRKTAKNRKTKPSTDRLAKKKAAAAQNGGGAA